MTAASALPPALGMGQAARVVVAGDGTDGGLGHGCPQEIGMDEVEAIKRLKARYFRTMDTKDWAGMREVFADDVVVDTTASGGGVVTGADEFMAFLSETLADVVTVHHGHMPEIELTSATTATGIWALQDILKWPTGAELHGYGHYHETYAKHGDAWRITSTTLTRLHMDFKTG